jgi:hypothetical protein
MDPVEVCFFSVTIGIKKGQLKYEKTQNNVEATNIKQCEKIQVSRCSGYKQTAHGSENGK